MNFNLNRVANDVINVFPAFGGKRVVQGYALTAAYSVNRQHLFSNISLTSNRNNAELRNHFTNVEDVATEAGVLNDGFDHRINQNPLNYGLPNLVLNNFTGLSETQPNYQLTQVIALSGSSSWEHGAHIVRFGGDIRRIEFNLFGGTNATGTFVFTGAYTQQEGVDRRESCRCHRLVVCRFPAGASSRDHHRVGATESLHASKQLGPLRPG